MQLQPKLFDFQSWNFIIFIVLSLLLVTIMAITLKESATSLGVQAGFVCPRVQLRNPEDCPQGWKVEYKQIDSRRRKCPILTCPRNDVEKPVDMIFE